MKTALVSGALTGKSDIIKNILVVFWTAAEKCLVEPDYKCHMNDQQAFVSNFSIVNDYSQDNIQGFEYS